MDYQRCIVRDPNVCGGEPVIKGTRVTIRTILASLEVSCLFQYVSRSLSCTSSSSRVSPDR